MITVAIFNMFAVFFAFLAGYRRDTLWLKVSFVVIFLFLALRYDYGNDYDPYLQSFLNINQLNATGVGVAESTYYETGWVFLCYLFKPVGFFAMIAVLALFNCIVYYRFIIKYVPPAYYWLAVFIYVFDPSFMLIQASAMRQALAIGLFLISLDYLYKKDALRYFLCGSLAALFHTSALILFPVYLLRLFNWKITNLRAIGIFTIFVLTYVLGESLLPYIQRLLSFFDILNRYEEFQFEAVKVGTGLGIVLFSCMFALVLFYARSQTAERLLLFKFVSISYLLMALGLFMMSLGRVQLYFESAEIAVFPLIIINTKDQVFRYLILAILVFIILYSFFVFFNSDTYKEFFYVYKTIFSSPELY